MSLFGFLRDPRWWKSYVIFIVFCMVLWIPVVFFIRNPFIVWFSWGAIVSAGMVAGHRIQRRIWP